MSIIPLPADMPIRSIQWTLDRPAQINVSMWTGARTVMADPWHGKWSAKIEFSPIVGESKVLRWRAFLAKLKGAINCFRLYATEGAQNDNSGVIVDGTAPAGAVTMDIIGASTSLKEGQFFNVNGQLCCCTSDQSGATLTFEPPLRQAANDGTRVVTSRPYALVYLANSQAGWSVGAGQVYGISFDVEEAILEVDGDIPEAGATVGIFFNSTTGDTFTGSKISVPSDATLTTTAAQIAFNSSTAKSLDVKLKRADASILKFAFDEWTVDCSFAVNSFPDPTSFDIAAFFGVIDDALGNYCGSLRADNPSTVLKNELYSANTRALTESGNHAFTAGDIVRCRYTRSRDLTTVTWSYPGSADHVLTYTQVFTAGISEMNRSFITPFIRFIQANIVLKRLVVSVEHPNPRFAFVGDSITKGYGTSTYVNGFASRIRTDYPGETIVCGASGTATTDWATPLQDVLAMRPQYLFLMLGTNDNLGGDMAGTKTRYTALVNQIIAAGVTPIVLAVLPKNEVWQAIFNSWLSAQGWRFIDTYTPMLGTGNAMNAAYTSDGIHPNDAGAVVLHNVVESYITAQGL